MLLTGMGVSAALVVSLLWDLRGAQRVGRIVHSVRSGRGWRRLALAGIAVVALVALTADTDVPRSLSLLVLVPSALLVVVMPGFRDEVLGEDGVRSGWRTCRFEDLEEWRLTGDHLRWKQAGEWRACEVPAAAREQVRARLERAAADRESRFRA